MNRSDYVYVITSFPLISFYIDTVFKALHDLASSQLKDEIKVLDHRKYKEMFNTLQEGIIIVAEEDDGLELKFRNEIGDIIF